jgi:CSLREA domain-containing protein
MLLLMSTSSLLAGATYHVNSTADSPDVDPADGVCQAVNGNCTLRAAVMQANFTGGVTIIVPAGTYTLTRPGFDDNALVGDLDITKDVTIQGAGSSLTIIDGNGSVTHDRVFQILSTAQNVTLSGMTVRNGESLSSSVGTIGGGGLLIEGAAQVHLSNVIFDGNTGQNGGGIYANFSSTGGSLQLDHVVIRSNKAIAGGVGAGGGIFTYLPSSTSQFTIQDSQVYSNTADGTGGGLFVQGNNQTQWSIKRSEIYSNMAASGGAIGNFVPLSLSDSSLHDNHVSFDGGAMEAFSPYVILRTTLNANSAGRYGGGIFNLQDGAGMTSFQDFAHIETTAFSGNAAKYGGAIYHDGFITPGSLLTLVNSTVSGNSVAGASPTPSPSPTPGAAGGGLYIYGGQVQLLNTTIASNRVNLGFLLHQNGGIGGGLYFTAQAMFTAQNSLIANNARGNGIMLDTPDDGFSDTAPGPITGQLAFDLIETTTNFFVTGPQGGNIFGQDPLLGPLQNNGGPTQTHALLPGSPAINAANGNAPARDQRGYIRPDAPDIGSFEFGGTIPVRLANISTRGFVQTGNNVLIGGLIITGGGSKQIVLRALGPTLGKPPFNVPNVLADPILELHDSTGALIISNDNWGNASNAAAINASGYAPPDNKESAILTNLIPGNYTAIVRGVNNTTGVALFDAYDLDDTTTTSKFGNISTRAFVGTGGNVMIAGVIAHGPDSENAIVRALGPTLGPLGVPNFLADPVLDLRDANGNEVMTNDNWKSSQQAEIQASGYAPPNDLESAMSVMLAPGSYTAILSGKNNGTGNALLEVYGLN